MSNGLVNVAFIVPRTEAEGPGERYALWVQGCPMRCTGCCNPEMLAFEERDRRDPEELAQEAVAADVEGVSILGGEPFSQPGPLARFARAARDGGLSVMVFSGHPLEQLRARDDADTDALLAATDLLVDGPYVESKRTLNRRWIGSDNQRLHFLTDRYSKDDPRFRERNHLELRIVGDRIEMNGWPVLGAATRVGGD